MDTRLKDIVSRENRNSLFAFLGAQIFNIIVTMLIAWLMFGIVKPALWPTHHADEAKVEAATEDKEFKLQVIGGDTDVVPTDEEFTNVSIKVVE
jgi:hypothetical protein